MPNCDETFNAGICYVTDAYKRVCGFNEELHADLEKCRSENAKLRERVAELEGLTDGNRCIPQEWCQLAMSENAKLRELVRHMHTCMEHYEMDGTISCDRCPLDNCVGNCDYEHHMRELGIEVDDA